jgi:hypothetical protein
MSTRFDNLSAAVKTNLQNFSQADHVNGFLAVEAKFDSGNIRVWTGLGDLTVGGNTYTGVGDLITIGEIEDTNEITSNGLSITLSGMNKEVLDIALTENFQNRIVNVFMGFLSGKNESAGEFQIYSGRITDMSISDGPRLNNISIELENRLIDFERPSNLRYTKESQQDLFAGDKGLDFVTDLQEADITWGPRKARAGGSSSSRGGNDITGSNPELR